MLDDFFHPTRNCCGLIPTGRYGNCDTLIDHTLKHCPQIDPSSKIHVIKTRAHAHTYMHGYTPGWHSHQCTHIGACQRVLEEGGGGCDGKGEGREGGSLGRRGSLQGTLRALYLLSDVRLFFSAEAVAFPLALIRSRSWRKSNTERLQSELIFLTLFRRILSSFPTYSLTLFHHADLISTLEHNSRRTDHTALSLWQHRNRLLYMYV